MPTFDSTDLDNASSESGVVHESVTNTDHNDASNLKQGYQIANPYLSADLIGYWPLHENSGGTAYDFSGNNNDGTSNGALTQGATGLLGTTSYSFDGTDDYVSISSPNYDFATSGVTFSAWINRDAIGNSHTITAIDGNSTHWEFFIRAGSPDTLELYYASSGTNGAAEGSTSIDDNIWYFVVGIYDPSNNELRVYVNGELDGSGSEAGPLDATKNSNAFGERTWVGDWQFHGAIANVRAYDRVLTASEVQYLYDVVNTSGTLTTQFKTV